MRSDYICVIISANFVLNHSLMWFDQNLDVFIEDMTVLPFL